MKHVFVVDARSLSYQQWKIDAILDSIGQYFRKQKRAYFSVYMSRYRRHAMTLINLEVKNISPGRNIRVYAVGGREIFYDCINAAAHYPNVEITAVSYSKINDFLYIFGEDKAELFKDIPSLAEGTAYPADIIRWGINYAINIFRTPKFWGNTKLHGRRGTASAI